MQARQTPRKCLECSLNAHLRAEMINPITTYRRVAEAYIQWAHAKRAPVHCVLCLIFRSIMMEISR